MRISTRLTSPSFNPAMLKNYIKTAVRNLSKNKFFTVLNVFGLALGMSISLLFIAMLSFLFRFDNFHAKRDQIFRITTHIKDNQDNPHYASAPAGLAQKLRNDFTGIEKVVAIHGSLYGEANYLEKKIRLNGYFAEPEFLQVFSFPLVKGDAVTALSRPNSIIITETEARNIFGDKDPFGEIIKMEPYGDFVVTGILKDIPRNSHMNFEAVVSYSTLLSHKGNSIVDSEEGWSDFINSYIYILLPENAETSRVEHYLDQVAKEKYVKGKDLATSFELQSLNKIIPGPAMQNTIGVAWDLLSIILIGSMSLIILLPACSNYVNLAISQSLKRMKEIGVRKVMGGQKKQIVFQFVMETTITMLLALALSYLMFELIRGEVLAQMASEGDVLELTPTPLTVVYFILFALILGLAAGIVPAIYFARITPVVALKGKPEVSRNGMKFSFRKVVITAQFMLSLGFIMAVMIMLQQYRYSVSYDFGFQQQNIFDVELQKVDPQQFKTEYEKFHSISTISSSSHIPGLGYSDKRYITINLTDSIEAASMSIDENFIANLEIELLAGSDFSDHAMENAHSIIVNEELVKKLNIPDPGSAINKSIVMSDGTEVTIRGVVKNFHYASLRTLIGGFFFEYDPSQFRYANMKVASTNSFGDTTAMEAAWKGIGGVDKFKPQLLSDEIEDAYSFYFSVIKIWGFLGLLAITVSCLGLLGTVVFTVKNRVKEVSIRKVMGASSESLIYLLSKDFVYLMLIASVLTTPAVYFLFDHLLVSVQYYSIKIGFMEIAISLVIIMVLGLATILSQTRKAANANPVDNLKIE